MNVERATAAEFTLRRGEAADAPVLAAICRESFPHTARWQASRATAERWWAGAIESRAAEVWVAARGQSIGGLLLVISDEGEWARQRSGLARPNWRDPAALAMSPKTLCRIAAHRVFAPPAGLGAGRRTVSPPTAAGPRLWLELIAVSPGARGQGLGRRLVELCEHRAAILDRLEIRLRVEIDNASAVALYERDGFETIAVSRRALIMRRAVDPDLLPPRRLGLIETGAAAR